MTLLMVVLAVQATAQLSPAEIAKRVTPAVVLISASGPSEDSSGSGSGFVVDPSGTIITNLHVVEGATSVTVKLPSGDVYDHVQVRAFDIRKDLVVLQVPGFGLPTVQLGDSDAVQPGEAVVVIGNPLGVRLLEGSVSAGVVSAVRSIPEAGLRIIQTDAAAHAGSSGGPLINSSGHVVGVVSFKLRDTESLNFVVPINYARGLLSTMETFDLRELARRIGVAEAAAAPAVPAATQADPRQKVTPTPAPKAEPTSGAASTPANTPSQGVSGQAAPARKKSRTPLVLGVLGAGAAAGAGAILLTKKDPLEVDDDLDGFSEKQGDCNDVDREVNPRGVVTFSVTAPVVGTVNCNAGYGRLEVLATNLSCTTVTVNGITLTTHLAGGNCFIPDPTINIPVSSSSVAPGARNQTVASRQYSGPVGCCSGGFCGGSVCTFAETYTISSSSGQRSFSSTHSIVFPRGFSCVPCASGAGLARPIEPR